MGSASSAGNRQHVFDLLLHVLGLRGGQIDFVDHGNDGEVVARGEKRVGDGLRFDALARVHDQQRAFAGGKRARDFVGKIHVAGRVDQVQAVFVAVARRVVQADAFGLDGDAALALEVHGVEHLRGHFALAERAGQLEQAVGQRGFAVVDVRDDAEIPDELGIHGFSCDSRRRTRCALGARPPRPSNYRVCHSLQCPASARARARSRRRAAKARTAARCCRLRRAPYPNRRGAQYCRRSGNRRHCR